MKTLKTINSLLVKSGLGLAVIAMFFIMSCEQSADNPSIAEFESAELDAVAAADFDEIDDITEGAMGYSDGSIGGRTDGEEGKGRGMDERASCATVTHDKEAQTITIDFGDGCEGQYGKTRSGIIFITYTGKRFIPGSQWTITFENFYIDDRHIEGTRSVENVSETLDDNPKFHILLTDGKVTWPDGTFATREVDRYRVWVRASNPMMDEIHILEGSIASGINQEGLNYSSTVLADLIVKRACRESNMARIPVQGVKEVVIGDETHLVDFGDGECDSIVTITANGVTTEVDLAERHRNN